MPVPVDLSKRNDLIKNDVVKKDVYNAKVRNIEDKRPDITNWATKASLNAKINDIKGEIPSIINLATNASLNAKVNEVKGEICNITNLATTIILTAVENKIPRISNLVKKTDYSTKINETEKEITDHNHDKYITTPEFNKFTAEFFDLRLKRANLGSQSDIDNFVNKTDFDNELKYVTSNKNELNELSKSQPNINKKINKRIDR